MAGKDPEFVEGLAKGLSVIEAFDSVSSEMTLSEVARRTGLSPAAARRSLHTLSVLGYIHSVNRRFMLSAKTLTLGASYLRATRVEELVLPELRNVVARFGDAASLTTLDGQNVVYIAHYSEERARRLVAGIGVSYPAYATSMGKVLLAALPDEDRERYLQDFAPTKLTEHTIVTVKALEAEIKQTRRRGYGTAVDELDFGITALAVPVVGAGGTVIAALNTSAYSGRVSLDGMLTDRLEHMRGFSARLSDIIVRSPPLSLSLGALRYR
ncbi:IclR family transcriptional regulator C-terminal domain-containing protein [Aminobacter sp. MSH1]|uniref:IclR family transcriptional regulator domain-containing protein n=1 Tax=Aminobacter sp. MSH1 TaxID=374606 RepID=UPI001FDFC294|nr:IclR family transcriptional regulator C-terminal domain-containing protein [Aminobacter sp. MSH1]